MISEFRGPTRWLSNFHESPVEFEGVEYPTVEHAYQAAKCGPDMIEVRQNFLNCTAGQAKKLGAEIKKRDDWFDINLQIMHDLIKQKFERYPELRQKLLDTGDQHLEEGNNWGDTFWGICEGKGENHLGKILMKVREELK